MQAHGHQTIWFSGLEEYPFQFNTSSFLLVLLLNVISHDFCHQLCIVIFLVTQ